MAAPRQKIATVNRLMAVLDTAEAVATATSELARAGFGPDAITVLVGNEDADRIDSMGKVRGRWTRAWRLLQFTQTDQMVDLVVYEAALRDGRSVLAVHARQGPPDPAVSAPLSPWITGARPPDGPMRPGTGPTPGAWSSSPHRSPARRDGTAGGRGGPALSSSRGWRFGGSPPTGRAVPVCRWAPRRRS